MSDEETVLQIGYGSNIADPTEVDDPAAGTPVKVSGFNSHLQMVASYRRPPEELKKDGRDPDNYRGVFNVEPTGNADDVMNGILYQLGRDEARRIAQREKVYSDISVDTADITLYVDDPAAERLLESADTVTVKRSDRPRVESLRPNPQYLAEVLAGAKTWDQRMGTENTFFRDVLRMSEVSPGESLETYLQDPEHQQQVMRYLLPPDDVSPADWNWDTFASYRGHVAAKEDVLVGGRKLLNLWGEEQVTDREIADEARHMTASHLRELLYAIKDEHGCDSDVEVFHHLRNAAQESRELSQDDLKDDETDEIIEDIITEVRYLDEDGREKFVDAVARILSEQNLERLLEDIFEEYLVTEQHQPEV